MSAAIDRLAAERICVIGLGLIGGSIVRGLRAAGYQEPIQAGVLDHEQAQRAVDMGLVAHASADVEKAVEGATLIVVAVPIGAMPQVFSTIAGVCEPGAVITDTGSTKRSVIADARAALAERLGRFVPGHPIAGTEHSGLDAGSADLFTARRVILTPTPETDRDALSRVETLWAALGAAVSEMDAAHHDEVLAATSHLPHVLAFTLVDTLARMAERTEIFEYAAGGFTDFTRIASSSPDLWRDIVTANHAAILPTLERYIGDLEAVRAAIAAGDRDTLAATFTRAKAARDAFAAERG